MTAPVPSIVVTDDSGERALLDLDVVRWRYEELERAGYPTDVAIMLSAKASVDLHVACELLKHGATIHEALRILT